MEYLWGEAVRWRHRSGSSRRPGSENRKRVQTESRREVLIGRDPAASGRFHANHLANGRIDVECTLRHRTFDAGGLVQHGDNQITAVFKQFLEFRDEILRSIQRLDACPL